MPFINNGFLGDAADDFINFWFTEGIPLQPAANNAVNLAILAKDYPDLATQFADIIAQSPTQMTTAQTQQLRTGQQQQAQAFQLGQQASPGVLQSVANTLGLSVSQVYELLAGGGLLLVLIIVLKGKKR